MVVGVASEKDGPVDLVWSRTSIPLAPAPTAYSIACGGQGGTVGAACYAGAIGSWERSVVRTAGVLVMCAVTVKGRSKMGLVYAFSI